jgi:hypothetical protein
VKSPARYHTLHRESPYRQEHKPKELLKVKHDASGVLQPPDVVDGHQLVNQGLRVVRKGLDVSVDVPASGIAAGASVVVGATAVIPFTFHCVISPLPADDVARQR